MTYAAIDFETATHQMYSACAVGIVTIEDGIIVDEYSTLIQPPGNYYAYHNTRIHGIDASHTKDIGTFEDHYEEIHKRLFNKVIVAHNESFDRNVLKYAISHYGLSSKGLRLHRNWECTVKIYRSLGFHPNKLSDCCARLNIPLQHHEALSDARACALLYLNYLQHHLPKESNLSDIALM